VSRPVKWLLGAVAALVVLVVAALIAVPFLVDTPRVQALIASNASQALGRPVKFRSMSISIFPLPAVALHGLEIAEDPQFGSEPFLRLETGKVRLKLLPLFTGRVELGDITLKKPIITVIQAPDGRVTKVSENSHGAGLRRRHRTRQVHERHHHERDREDDIGEDRHHSHASLVAVLAQEARERFGERHDNDRRTNRAHDRKQKSRDAMGDPRRRGSGENEHAYRQREPEPHGVSEGSAHRTRWSARCNSDGGIVSPRAFAVFRLITSSNLVGASIGRSAGLAPLRILST
jgi:AsmA protein